MSTQWSVRHNTEWWVLRDQYSTTLSDQYWVISKAQHWVISTEWSVSTILINSDRPVYRPLFLFFKIAVLRRLTFFSPSLYFTIFPTIFKLRIATFVIIIVSFLWCKLRELKQYRPHISVRKSLSALSAIGSGGWKKICVSVGPQTSTPLGPWCWHAHDILMLTSHWLSVTNSSVYFTKNKSYKENLNTSMDPYWMVQMGDALSGLVAPLWQCNQIWGCKLKWCNTLRWNCVVCALDPNLGLLNMHRDLLFTASYTNG